MSEQRASWLQRLVGSDSGPVAALEEQLQKAKEEALRLEAELAREQERVADRGRQLQKQWAEAVAAERDFDARLLEAQSVSDERQAALADLERQHKQVASELAIARTQLVRQRDEATKLNKALAAANAQVARGETSLEAAQARIAELEASQAASQIARERIADLEMKLAASQAASKTARERSASLERTAETSAMELADARRRLQALETRAAAVETRASTVEHELAETKQAEQRRAAEAQQLKVQLKSSQLGQELAERRAGDAWRGLELSAGEAATLALILGVDPGRVDPAPTLADAVASLKLALERGTSYRVARLQAASGYVQGELSEVASEAVAAWLMALSIAHLEKASGNEFSLESFELEANKLTFRLLGSSAAA